MDEHIYPNEEAFSAHDDAADALMRDLQGQTKAMGMWAPHLPAEAGGMGIGFMPYVYLNEILGRSPFAPKSFGAQAPDSGNAEILWQFGTPEQQERWMKPLVEGEITSCFSMTEPDVSGGGPDEPADDGRARRRRVGDQRAQVVHERGAERVVRDRDVRDRAGSAARTAA